MHGHARLLTALVAVAALAAATAVTALSAGGARSSTVASSCQLSPDGKIKHLVYLQFDNTHFATGRTSRRTSSRCRTCSTS